MKKSVITGVFIGVAFILLHGITWAEKTEIEPIVVSAQKQQEDLQKLPASAAVLDDLFVEDANIGSINELGNYIPNLSLFDTGMGLGNLATIRGIGTTAHNNEAVVGLYVDGVPVTGLGYRSEIVDIEQIEVLRGPQGTLYGKNAVGGVINIITKKPDNEFRGKLSVDAGENQKRSVMFNLNFPVIKEKLFMNLSGRHFEKGGIIENNLTGNTIDDRENNFITGKIRWTPTDSLDILVTALNNSFDEGTFSYYSPMAAEKRKVETNYEGYNKSGLNSQAIRISYDFNDSYKLTSLTTKRTTNADYSGDYDLSPATINHMFVDRKEVNTSQELRLNAVAGPFKWVLAANYNKFDDDMWYRMDSDMPGWGMTFDGNYKASSYAVFGHLTWKLSKALSLISGLRYDYESAEFQKEQPGFPEFKDNWDSFSPKIAIEYQLNPDMMCYTSFAKGFRAGGYNHYGQDPSKIKYDNEELFSCEIGLKTMMMGNRLMVNSALFYNDYTDMQVETATETTTYISNAAEAGGYGAEIEFTFLPRAGLELFGSFGYTHMEFDSFTDFAGDYSGHKTSYSPEYTFNTGCQYRHASGLFLRGDFSYASKVYLDKTQLNKRPSVKLVNCKLGYELKHFDIYLYSKNLFDHEYDSKGAYSGFFNIASPPREIGMGINYRF